MQVSNNKKNQNNNEPDEIPIFALPDHQVVEGLLPDIRDKVVTVDDALDRINSKPTWVPVSISPDDGGKIYFADLGQYSYREWQHIYSIQHLADKGEIKDYFAVEAGLLDIPDLELDSIAPRGFIFHVSRCGSTLFGKALARADDIGIINQPAPLQYGFWSLISNAWNTRVDAEIGNKPLNSVRFKNIVQLLCQARIPNEKALFIKFISWNSLYFHFIHSVFPEVPCLFMYRNPVEVVASVARETTAVLTAKSTLQAEFLTGLERNPIDQIDDVTYLAICYARYFETMLDAGSGLGLLNYENVKKENLSTILSSAFNFFPEPMQLEQMQSQFDYYSKDDSDKTSFEADKHEKLSALEQSQRDNIEYYCRELYEKLNRSEKNLFPAI
jgi:hypothetical protein